MDVGTGTGVLAFFACRAGARKVYAVESSPAIELARQVCTRNGLQDRIVFLNDRSLDISLPEQVDVVVTETGASFGLQGGMLGSMIDARKRFLRKGGSVIPQSLELFVAPVEAPEMYQGIEVWNRELYGLDFSPIRSFAVNNHYRVKLQPQTFLSEPASLARISLSGAESTCVRGTASCIATRAGILHGIAGWAVTELAPGITFSNSPSQPTIQWAHSLFPVEIPVPLHEGDCVKVTIASNDGADWRWQVETVTPPDRELSPSEGKRQFDQSTLHGFPVSKETLSRQASSYKPKLSAKGEAGLFVLSAFNGEKTIEELEREVLCRYGDSVFSATAVSLFLKEIVTLCA